MLVMGIGGSNHDHSAAIVRDGKLLVAVEDERVVKKKKGDSHWASRPCLAAAEYCLAAIQAKFEDIDFFFLNDDIDTAFPFWEDYRHRLVQHHLAHAASAFYMSPFEEAALLVIDGKGSRLGAPDGEFETASIGIGRRNQCSIENLQSGYQRISSTQWRYVAENSLGWFYRTVTDAIGFGMSGEGKTMGLASYGQTRFVKPLKEFYSFDNKGRFFFDPYSGIWDYLGETLHSARNTFQIRADLAASVQHILEEGVLRAAKAAKVKFREPRLCYAGGVALNGVANHRLRLESGFEEVFLWPPCGDNGLSVGAALYGYYSLLDNQREWGQNETTSMTAFCGREYSEQDLKNALASFPVAVRLGENIPEQIVELLLAREPIAIFRGGSEIGPRALGHRSIFHDPTDPKGRDRLNRIKRRESFRPFAPIVLEEDAGIYFDLVEPSPFMLDIAPVRQKFRSVLAAVTHIDGTARLQTVPKTGDALLVKILTAMRDRGSPPVILNTSFNLSGKPIVETPRDALEAFMKLDLNTLLLDNYWGLFPILCGFRPP